MRDSQRDEHMNEQIRIMKNVWLSYAVTRLTSGFSIKDSWRVPCRMRCSINEKFFRGMCLCRSAEHTDGNRICELVPEGPGTHRTEFWQIFETTPPLLLCNLAAPSHAFPESKLHLSHHLMRNQVQDCSHAQSRSIKSQHLALQA